MKAKLFIIGLLLAKAIKIKDDLDDMAMELDAGEEDKK
jgi:hypothetical protein